MRDGAEHRDEREQDDDVEEAARVAGVAEHLEQDADDDRAEHDPGLAAGAAEDDHRVDGDQQRELEVLREDAAVERRGERARERRRPTAPNANAISLSRLTGMPISSAASGSSRSDRHARPVRESLRRRSAT